MRRMLLAACVMVMVVAAACSEPNTLVVLSPDPVPSVDIPTPLAGPALEVGAMTPYETTRFRVDMPKNWTVVEGDVDPDNCNTTVCFVAPGTAGGLPIAIITVTAIPTDVDLEKTWKHNQTIAQSTWAVPARLDSSRDTTWNGEPAIFSHFVLPYRGLASEGEQTMMVVDDMMYAVSGGAQRAYWEDTKEVVRQMLDSFELISAG